MNTTPESPTAQSQVNLGLLLAGLIVEPALDWELLYNWIPLLRCR